MLAGKRLFWGENDYATVKLVQKANIPRLSPINREVDEAFEEVLLKALTRDPSHRYQSAREFGDALSDYLFRNQLMVTAYDLANMVQAVTSEESHATADEFSLIDRLIQEELDESEAIVAASRSGSLPRQSQSEPKLRAGESYEDPASWFSDDKDFVPEPPKRASSADSRSTAKRVPDVKSQSGSWREAGIPDEPASVRQPPPSLAPASVRAAREAEDTLESDMIIDSTDPMPSHAPPPSLGGPGQSATLQTKGGHIKYVLVAVLAMAVAAVAWLGTRLG
jgi:serine/threonine-protein kinase